MKTFEFTEQEIQDLRNALNYYVQYVYMEDGPYDRVKALADRLTPKKVTKEGWLIINKNGAYGVYRTEVAAKRDSAGYTDAQVVKTTWEQEE